MAVSGSYKVSISPDLTKFKGVGNQIKGELTGQAGAIKTATEGMTSNLNTEAVNTPIQKTTSALKGLAVAAAGTAALSTAKKIATDSISSFTSLAASTLGLQRVIGGTAEQVSSMTGAMQLSGIDSTKAASSLTIFSKNVAAVAGDSKKTAAMQKLLGTSIMDANGQVKPMVELLPAVADRFKSMPDGVQKTALATQLFGRAGTSMLPFLNQGLSGITKLEAKAKSLGLTLTDSSTKDFKAYKASQRELNLAMQGMKVTLGTLLIPALIKFSQFVTSSVVPALQNLISWFKTPAVQQFVANTVYEIQQLSSTAMPIIKDLGSMLVGIVSWASANGSWLNPIVLGIGGLVLAIKAYGAAVAAVNSVQAAWNTAVTGMKWATQTAGVVAHTTAVVAQKTAVGIATGAQWLWNAAVTGVKWAAQTLALGAHTAAILAQKAAVGIATGAQWLFNAAVTGVKWAIQTAGLVAQTVALGAQKVALGIATAAQWLFNAAMDANPIGLVVIAIAALVAGLALFFTKTEMGRQAWSSFIGWLGGAWNWLRGVASSTWGAISSFFTSIPGRVRGAWSGIAGWFNGIWNSISNSASGIWGRISGFFTSIPGHIHSSLSGIFGVGRDLVNGLWNGINSGWGTLWGNVKKFGHNLVSGFKKLFKIGSPSKVMSDEVGRWLPAGIGVGIGKNAAGVLSTASGLASKLTSTLSIHPEAGWTMSTASQQMISTQKALSTSGISTSTTAAQPRVTINQTIDRADSLSDIYSYTRKAARGYFSRTIVPQDVNTRPSASR